MRNSREKYGEIIGFKLEKYVVSGFLSLQITGRQKQLSEIEPDNRATDEESGSAEMRCPRTSPSTTATRKVSLNRLPVESEKIRETNCELF